MASNTFKERPRILVTEELGPQGLAYLEQFAEVEAHRLLPLEELSDKLNDVDAVIIRSAHRITRELITGRPRLKVVARAGAGVDNVDLKACTDLGITVINAPGANAIAAAEHTFGLLLATVRNIRTGDRHVRAGGWDRQSYVGVELFGKRLGIIGLGRVGREVTRIARGFRMEVMAYDPFIAPDVFTANGALRSETLEGLVEWADVLTIHTPKTGPKLGYDLLKRMRHGSVVLNVARGGLMDESAVARLLEEGVLSRTAYDVFVQEPPSHDLPLLGRDDVVVTPHLGGSTDEAMAKVGLMTAEGVIEALKGRIPFNTVNVPIPVLEATTLESLEQAVVVLAQLFWFFSENLPKHLFLTVSESVPEEALPWLRQSLIGYILGPVSDERVNAVNALAKAEAHGLELAVGRAGSDDGTMRLSLLSGPAAAPMAELEVNGGIHVRVLGGVNIDAPWPDRVILTEHHDQPGIVGKIGTVLGTQGYNIAGMTLGRNEAGGKAYMLLSVDEMVDEASVTAIRALPGLERTAFIARVD